MSLSRSQSKVIGRDPQLDMTLRHNIYRQIAQTDSPNTHGVYCYLLDTFVCLVFCIFLSSSSFLQRKTSAHPKLASKS